MDRPESVSPKPGHPGALIGGLALIVGGLWIAGSMAAVLALLGVERVVALTPLEAGALAAAVLLPAFMAWFSGAAVADGARARVEAARLADAADRLFNPERSAEDAARRLAMSVRAEISTLDRALEQTLARLREVELQIARHAQSVDSMTDQAKAGANQMISGMEREREELLKISQELNSRAQTIGDSISRHTQSISEAARRAEAEVRAADQALDHRLTSFGAAAALISDRTHGLSSAAQASADSALRLETALSHALDILAKATNLTDAARQSAEAASLAANSTAGAIRDTTVRAIDDAKRAADVIRGEAVNVERDAAIALERLRDAADAARSAAIGARAAIEDTHGRARTPRQDNSWRNEPDPMEQAPPTRSKRGDEPLFGEASGERASDWTWRDLLSSTDNSGASDPHQPPRRESAGDPVAHLRRQISQPRASSSPKLAIVESIEHADLRLGEVFTPSALERIAQRARSGTQSRRRAVQDAAPDAARRLAQHLTQDDRAKQEAMQFLRNEGARIAELLGRGRASMSAEATQAFLLVDAAAG